MRALILGSVMTVVVAFPGMADAQGPMIEIDLLCEEPIGAITVRSNPVWLWSPGHVVGDDDTTARTHVVTSIFGHDKGATNEALDTVECTVVGGPLDGLTVWGVLVP